MPQIKPDSLVRDILRSHPETLELFKSHGMLCASCTGSESEPLRHAAQNHGVSLSSLIEELLAVIKSGS